jgi:DNA-binding protein HU-beta
MTKAELVSQIARETGYDKASVLTILECALSDIKKNVAAGENVYVRGFGSFVTIVRKEKIARNITKKTSIVVPEHKIPGFKPAHEFTAMVRK